MTNDVPKTLDLNDARAVRAALTRLCTAIPRETFADYRHDADLVRDWIDMAHLTLEDLSALFLEDTWEPTDNWPP